MKGWGRILVREGGLVLASGEGQVDRWASLQW